MITNDKKKVLLKHFGWTEEEGYAMEYDRADDDSILGIFITKEEWITKTLEGCKTYYWNGKTERMLDLDEAWEYLEEDEWDKNNIQSEVEINEYFEKVYAKIVSSLNIGNHDEKATKTDD